MTGDLGSIDAQGYLRIAGRSKDIIIRGGHNIHPARVEELATRHPAVQRAAAIPMKDARLGEKVCLAVVTRAGADVAPAELLAHLDAAGLSKIRHAGIFPAARRDSADAQRQDAEAGDPGLDRGRAASRLSLCVSRQVAAGMPRSPIDSRRSLLPMNRRLVG